MPISLSLSTYARKFLASRRKHRQWLTDLFTWYFYLTLCWQTEPNTPARRPHRHPTNVRFQQVPGVFLGFSFEFHDLNHSTTSSHVPDVSRLCYKVDKCILEWVRMWARQEGRQAFALLLITLSFSILMLLFLKFMTGATVRLGACVVVYRLIWTIKLTSLACDMLWIWLKKLVEKLRIEPFLITIVQDFH